MAKADKKFFFHMHNFDEEAMGSKEEDVPPPIFTEADLEAATKEAYAKGHADGLQESKESRSQFVAGLLEKIAMQTQALFAQEDSREKTYEREAVALSLSLFEKLFPVYHDKHGFTELQDQLLGVLKSQEGLKFIHISVAPSYAEGIGSFMSKLSEKDGGIKFKVSGDETTPEGAAYVSWDDGGAVRDAHAMAAQIKNRIQEILAGARVTSHDGDVAVNNAPVIPEASDTPPDALLKEPKDE